MAPHGRTPPCAVTSAAAQSVIRSDSSSRDEAASEKPPNVERRDAGPPIGIKILEHMSRQKFHLRGTAPWRCATRPPKLRGRSLRWTNMRQGWEFLLVSVAGVVAVLASAISHAICHALFNFLVDHLRALLAFLAPHAITWISLDSDAGLSLGKPAQRARLSNSGCRKVSLPASTARPSGCFRHAARMHAEYSHGRGPVRLQHRCCRRLSAGLTWGSSSGGRGNGVVHGVELRAGHCKKISSDSSLEQGQHPGQAQITCRKRKARPTCRDIVRGPEIA